MADGQLGDAPDQGGGDQGVYEDGGVGWHQEGGGVRVHGGDGSARAAAKVRDDDALERLEGREGITCMGMLSRVCACACACRRYEEALKRIESLEGKLGGMTKELSAVAGERDLLAKGNAARDREIASLRAQLAALTGNHHRATPRSLTDCML